MATFNPTFIGTTRNTITIKSTSFRHHRPITFSSRKTVVAMGGGARYKGTYIRERKLAEMIESKVTEAKETCAGDESSDECKVAWDEVEEISQAKAHLRVKLEREEDPMEAFCSGNPETEECRVCDE